MAIRKILKELQRNYTCDLQATKVLTLKDKNY